MTDATRILVDSNVIIDVVRRDPRWVEWSVATLSRFGNGFVNPLIYAELCYQKTSFDEVDRLLVDLGLGYDELPREALYLASQAFRRYRELGGTKTSPLADFFIGAHAVVLGVPLMTRDVGRYKTYFPIVPLVTPSID